MSRELSKKEIGAIYRQFSRQRYNKLKHQYPKMRQSEIVSKIIKEWEGFSLQNKKSLFSEYKNRNLLSEDKSQSSYDKGLQKTGEKKDENEANSLSEEKDHPHHEIAELQSIQVEMKPFSGLKISQAVPISIVKTKEQSKELSKSEKGPYFHKTKQIKKSLPVQGKNREYINFFKYHYQKLSSQHSRWSSSQISNIIRLLWKKRCQRLRIKKSDHLNQQRRKMILSSGRRGFVQHCQKNGMEKQEISIRWFQLPKQSKLVWKRKGIIGFQNNVRPSTFILSLRNEAAPKTQNENKDIIENEKNIFSFLKNKMGR